MRPAIIYVARRLLTTIGLLLVLSFVLFVLIQREVPGNEASILAGNNATTAQVHAVEVKLGLTRSIFVQYGDWLGHAVRGDFGTSQISQLSITSVVGQQAPVSLELALLGLLIATVVGVPVGLLAGIVSGSKRDLALRAPFLVLYAVPFFVSGSLLLLAASRYFPSVYATTFVPFATDPGGNLKAMLLPALAVGLPVSGLLLQMTRATVAEVLRQPHILTARAAGLSRARIYGVYTLKAAAQPILSLEGFLLGILIGGVVVIEQVFSLPGLGRGLLSSIANRDFVQLEAQVLVVAVTFCVGNLLADLAAPLVDRRIVHA